MNKPLSKWITLAVALVTSSASAITSAYEVPTNNKDITLDQIMSDPKWIAQTPTNPRFGADGKLYFNLPSDKSSVSTMYRFDDGQQSIVTAKDKALWVPANSGNIVSRNGDLFYFDGDSRVLTQSSDRDSNPVIVGDGKAMFMRGNRVMSVDLASGAVREVLSISYTSAPSDEKGLYVEQQAELFEYVKKQQRERADREAAAEQIEQASEWMSKGTVYLGADKSPRAYSISPSGRWLVVRWVSPKHDTGRADVMPHFVTEDGYVYAEDVRALVGTAESLNDQFTVIDLLTGTVAKDLDLTKLPGIKQDPLAAIKRATAKANGEKYKPSSKARTVSLNGANWGGSGDLQWSADGRYLLMALKSADNKDRWVTLFDTERLSLKSVFNERDEAWINTFDAREYGWTQLENVFYFVSEKSGYPHLYVGSPSTRPVQLTKGEFEVDNIEPRGDYLYFSANKTHPGEYEVYRVPVKGGEVEQITSLGGVNEYRINDVGNQLVISHSTSWRPADLFVQEIGGEAKQITDTVTQDFKNKPWIEPKFVPIESSHSDQPIWTKVYVDESVKVEGKRPAVIFVHGAGYTQNSHMGWPYYYREQMFHSMLANLGYVVIDMDYRASEGYGRDWRTAIYRDMGRAELEDFQDGINWMVKEHNVDPGRVGIYGGSYGGFMALMAMFKEPGVYAAGAALRPVTDWAHYNHGYTSSILNTPEIDPEAYRRSSPIYFAEGLEGKLLIAHGMLDDNVFVKDSVRLQQRLIELRKPGWEAAYYPIEPHGYTEPSSWYDQYRRIFELFESTIGEEAQ